MLIYINLEIYVFIYLKITVTETGRKETKRFSLCWFTPKIPTKYISQIFVYPLLHCQLYNNSLLCLSKNCLYVWKHFTYREEIYLIIHFQFIFTLYLHLHWIEHFNQKRKWFDLTNTFKNWYFHIIKLHPSFPFLQVLLCLSFLKLIIYIFYCVL